MMMKSVLSYCIFYGLSLGQRPPTAPMAPVTTSGAAQPRPGLTRPAIIPVIPAPAPPVVVPVTTEPPIVPVQPVPAPPVVVPVNPAPIAPAPTVPAPPMFPHVPVPAPPSAPQVPAGFALGRFGQLCGVNANAVCQTQTDIASGAATPGFVKCEGSYDCCLCAAVDCIDCIALTAGNSGMFGVKSVNVYGGTRGGAQIICQGTESCAETIITGEKVGEVQVTGDMGLRNAHLTVNGIVSDFKLHCTGSFLSQIRIFCVLYFLKTTQKQEWRRVRGWWRS